MTRVLIGVGRGEDREEGRVKTGRDWNDASACPALQTATEQGENCESDSASESPGGAHPADTWIFDFRPPEL